MQSRRQIRTQGNVDLWEQVDKIKRRRHRNHIVWAALGAFLFAELIHFTVGQTHAIAATLSSPHIISMMPPWVH